MFREKKDKVALSSKNKSSIFFDQNRVHVQICYLVQCRQRKRLINKTYIALIRKITKNTPNTITLYLKNILKSPSFS